MFVKALFSRCLLMAAILFLFALCVQNGFAQVNNSVSGFVFGINRMPVAMARVELLSDLYQTVGYRITSGNGLYTFNGLSQGRYRIRVTTPDGLYLEHEEDVEIVNVVVGTASNSRVTGSDRQQRDVYLQLRPEYAANLNAVGVIIAQEVPESARRDFEKGVELLEDKKTEAGIERLKNSLQTFPEYYLALRRLSEEYMKSGKFEEAIELLLRMSKINERDGKINSQIAGAYYNLKKDDDALKYAQKSLETSKSYYPHYLIAMIYKRRGKFAEAEQSFQAAKKLSDNKVGDVHYQLALLYCNNLMKFNEAANELELYLKTKPQNVDKEKVKELIKTFRTKAAQPNSAASKI